MASASTAVAETADAAAAPANGLRFTVGSRPQRRFSNTQVVSNLLGSTSFQPIQLPATGWVRKIALLFTFTGTAASAGALVAGDGPWNLVAGVTLTDATGQPVVQPISGYNLYLLNKYLPSGVDNANNPADPYGNPHLGPEFAYSATATAFTATFRLDIDLEQDRNTGYGSIPNLDSNASLQVRIDVAPYSVAFSGTTVTAANLAVRITQYYWAPIADEVGGVPAQSKPVGFGDYTETRFETQPVSAGSENLVNLTNRGGLVKGVILVSRAAGVRTAFQPGANLGLVLDNNPIDEGVPIEEHHDLLRRTYGYYGQDLTTSYAPLTPGVMSGLDRGVQVLPFAYLSGGRDSWLVTRVGSLLQVRLTPAAGATQLDIITQLAQVKDPAAFYGPSALV